MTGRRRRIFGRRSAPAVDPGQYDERLHRALHALNMVSDRTPCVLGPHAWCEQHQRTAYEGGMLAGPDGPMCVHGRALQVLIDEGLALGVAVIPGGNR